MMSKLAENKKLVLIMAFIFMIQCAVLVYWQEQRGNFYVDELFSFGYANSFSAESSHYIIEDESWKYDTWINAEDLVSQLEVNEDNSLLSLPITEQFRLLSTKRTYMGMLNIIMSFTDPLEGYAKGALVLNILFLLISEVLLGTIISMLTRRKEIVVLSIVMFGFSAIIIGMCEYVRFYMFVIMLLLFVLFCHIKLWGNNNFRSFLILELLAFISAYYALKQSELMLVVCGSFFCFFFIALLIRRKFRNAIMYAAPLLVGTYVFVYRGTNLFDVVLHPSHYADLSYWGIGSTTYYLLTVTPDEAVSCLDLIKDCISSTWFGAGFLVFVFLGLSIVWGVLIVVDRSAAEPDSKEPDKYKGFMMVIALTVITDITFNVLTNLSIERYSSFAIVMMMILFWYSVGLLQREYPSRIMLAAFAIVTVAGVVMCQQGDRLPYLYVDDTTGPLLSEKYLGMDSVIIRSDHTQVAYDCVIHTGSNARIYVTNPSRIEPLDETDLPEQFLAWCHESDRSDRMHVLLDGTGYSVKKLGKTHVSAVYICSRK